MDSIVNLIISQLLNNPLIQGSLVSLVVAKLRDVFKGMDAAAKDPAQVKNVQLLVGLLSLVVTLGTAWAGGHLSQVDPQVISGVVTNLISVLVGAMATHQVGQDIKKAVAQAKK
jgi:xanthine/uracil permease